MVGNTSTGAINVGTANLSANGFSGFSLVTRGSNSAEGVFFDNGEQLILPASADIRILTGSGNVEGQTDTRNIIAASGTIRFTAGAVTIGTQVANLQASTLQNGFVLNNRQQGLTIQGAQRAGAAFSASANTADYGVAATGDITLASGTTITAQDVLLVASANFNNNAGASPFVNQNGGRTLISSTQPIDNSPPTATGGLSGFGTVYNTTLSISANPATPGVYTVSTPLPGGNLMVFRGPPSFAQIEPGTATYNELVDTAVYKTAVPVQGYSLPGIYSGQVRLGFKAAAAAVQNSLGKAAPAQPTERAGRLRVGDAKPPAASGPMAGSAPAVGRLRVGQAQSANSKKTEVGAIETPAPKPSVKAGNVSLRMSGEFLPFELAEVTITSPKVGQNR